MTAEPTSRNCAISSPNSSPAAGHVMPALHKVQDTYGYISRSPPSRPSPAS